MTRPILTSKPFFLLVALLALPLAGQETQPSSSPPKPPPQAPQPQKPAQTEAMPLDVEVDAKAAESLHREGLQALAAGQLETAVDLLQQATARAPDDLLVGTDYRQAVIAHAETLDTKRGEVKAAYGRAVEFFERLVATYPDSANAHLNHAFALVDKIPAEGAITQVLLANDSLKQFGKALDLEESWLGYYSRGHAYLFWPPIFGRVEMGISDLERAVAMSKEMGDRQPYYARAWAALGDGYWRLDDVQGARNVWKQGLAIYPDDAALRERWQRQDRAALDEYLEVHYDTSARVATHLNEIYGDRLAGLPTEQVPEGVAAEEEAE